MLKKVVFTLLLLFSLCGAKAQNLKLGLLVYGGGGDWYANPTALKNLAQYCNQKLETSFGVDEAKVEIGSPDIFNYAFLHMTGHGRWAVSEDEVQNLRNYLLGGGFLHIDDNYGLDEYVRPALKKVFPNAELVEVPYSHSIYKRPFVFSNGLPKIHEHDSKAPKAYGIFIEGRLVCLYTTETDLGDGWEDPEVHRDTNEAHVKALQMGANIVYYALVGDTSGE